MSNEKNNKLTTAMIITIKCNNKTNDYNNEIQKNCNDNNNK